MVILADVAQGLNAKILLQPRIHNHLIFQKKLYCTYKIGFCSATRIKKKSVEVGCISTVEVVDSPRLHGTA